MEKEGFLSSQMMGKEKIYLNNRLFEIIKKSNEV
ncbi:hypothetical protein [Clostridium sp.]